MKLKRRADGGPEGNNTERTGQQTEPQSAAQTPTVPDMGGKKTERRPSILTYIAVLFTVAFLLLLLSYFMQQRNTAQMLEGLKRSTTAMENIELLQKRNVELEKEVEALTKQAESAAEQAQADKDQIAAQKKELEASQQQTAALAQFWKLVRAYETGAYRTCRQLIAEMEEAGLPAHLPEDTGSESAAAVYARIQTAVQR